MLIQNISNTAQAPQPARIVNNRLASDGEPVVVAAASSNVAAQPSVTLELPQATAKPAVEQQASAEQVKSAMENINRVLKQSDRNLEFSVDESTKKQMFKLTDAETGDVIRQYPTEEMLAISRAIDQVQQGLLLKQEA
ncbi:MAG: flagellar protein FlaG [Gallionella sp.]|nr:flagellar protein FlaG [Gallionella sp.]